MQGKLSMRTGRSPFSSPAQSPGVIPASCVRFMCLQPTTLTSRQDMGRLRQEKRVGQIEEAVQEQSLLAFWSCLWKALAAALDQ